MCYNSPSIPPVEFIEGVPTSPIWILGLNPKGPYGMSFTQTAEELISIDTQGTNYFRDFRHVSTWLFELMESVPSRVAHTDLVKCPSPTFPPLGQNGSKLSSKEVTDVIQNCSSYLNAQLRKHKPKLIIANGSFISDHCLRIFPPTEPHERDEPITSYEHVDASSGMRLSIILSGFIGRLDNRSRRRLGREIELSAKNCGLLIQ